MKVGSNINHELIYMFVSASTESYRYRAVFFEEKARRQDGRWTGK